MNKISPSAALKNTAEPKQEFVQANVEWVESIRQPILVTPEEMNRLVETVE